MHAFVRLDDEKRSANLGTTLVAPARGLQSKIYLGKQSNVFAFQVNPALHIFSILLGV